MGVWENSGAVLPGERPIVRQRYRMIELQRAAEIRNVALNPQPQHFPTNPTAADLCICAAVLSGNNPENLVFACGQAVWERNLQLADEDVLSQLIDEAGLNSPEILELSKSDEAAAMRASNTEDAVSADAIGAPAYVYADEVFWGQDRIEYLDHMIASGRNAYSSLI